MMHRQSILVLRVIIWSIPLVFFGWVIDRNLGIGGTVTMRCTAHGCDQRISSFASKEPSEEIFRTSDTGESFREITVDPLTLKAQLFRRSHRATVTMSYRNPDDQPRMNVTVQGEGPARPSVPFADDVPGFRNVVDSWQTVSDGDVRLFTRPGASGPPYNNIRDFLTNLPDTRRVATYNIDISPYLSIPGYQPAVRVATVPTMLRGGYTFSAYSGRNEGLDVTFSFQDSNRSKGKDPITVTVFHGDEEVTSMSLPDDGDDKGTDHISSARDLHVLVPQLPVGTFRIVVEASADIFTRTLTSMQKLFSASGSLFIVGGDEYKRLGGIAGGPLTVYVRGTTLSVKTAHIESLQTVNVGTKDLVVNEINRQFFAAIPPGDAPIPVTIQNRDVILETDGFISFSPESMITTGAVSVEQATDNHSLDSIDYLIATYAPVRKEGTWLIAERTFGNLPKGSSISFIMTGAPTLNESGKAIQVRDITLRFEVERLTLRRAYDRLRTVFMNLVK